jgi:hypothetical protein
MFLVANHETIDKAAEKPKKSTARGSEYVHASWEESLLYYV